MSIAQFLTHHKLDNYFNDAIEPCAFCEHYIYNPGKCVHCKITEFECNNVTNNLFILHPKFQPNWIEDGIEI